MTSEQDAFTSLTTIDHPIQQVVVPIIVKVYDRFFPIGTGFVVQGGGLLMTAGHVISDAVTRSVRRRTIDGDFDNYFEPSVLYQANPTHGDKLKGGLWPIERIWTQKNIDIGFCWLKNAKRVVDGERIRWPALTLSPGIPAVGTEIFGFGYHNMPKEIAAESIDGKMEFEYHHQTGLTRGKIINVHPEYRDRGMLSFPCFQVDARFEHGMSGGPVFYNSGEVCGVICSSSSTDENDDRYVSYASLIWPAFGIDVEMKLEPKKPKRWTNLLELARMGWINTDGTIRNIVMLDESEGHLELGIYY